MRQKYGAEYTQSNTDTTKWRSISQVDVESNYLTTGVMGEETFALVIFLFSGNLNNCDKTFTFKGISVEVPQIIVKFLNRGIVVVISTRF